MITEKLRVLIKNYNIEIYNNIYENIKEKYKNDDLWYVDKDIILIMLKKYPDFYDFFNSIVCEFI